MSTDESRAVSRPSYAQRAEGAPRARRLALAEVAVGLPAAAWGMRRRSVGWAAVGAVLTVHGVLELSYETVFPRD
ncbi:MAG: hypothetical protein JF597_05620 [Streptomyces sp.]|uniref:hypothetical protein n=1 Tax=Streptomyces sp. TaxID=1931 RepID=UPI0025EA1992|nr:hypothetical protein [Streptomyces sp.]MBW8793072.1 hypothetical protein [Streptomyces sp.]